ncbi:hypothetical protein P692DRAFT_20181243 [Suillus brevipes Sb2]|nr:hypothetical protein P692DRAFT_20181243 [Suillus brevipes Sb2]
MNARRNTRTASLTRGYFMRCMNLSGGGGVDKCESRFLIVLYPTCVSNSTVVRDGMNCTVSADQAPKRGFLRNFIHIFFISVDLSTSCLVVLLLHELAFLRVFYGSTQFFGPSWSIFSHTQATVTCCLQITQDFCHEGRDLM